MVAVAATSTSGGGNTMSAVRALARPPPAGCCRQSGQTLVGARALAVARPLRRRRHRSARAGRRCRRSRAPGSCPCRARAGCRGRPSARRGRRTWSGRSMAIRSTAGRVEAGGEHAHRGERPDLAALEGGDDAVALGRRACRRRWWRTRRRARGSPRATCSACVDAGAEHQPGAAVVAVGARPRRSRPR